MQCVSVCNLTYWTDAVHSNHSGEAAVKIEILESEEKCHWWMDAFCADQNKDQSSQLVSLVSALKLRCWDTEV
jgi:hypothetical protein